MYTHKLKIEIRHYKAVLAGIKPFEIRLNDRDFQVGDKLILSPGYVNSVTSKWERDYSKAIIEAEITYVSMYQQKEGYVVLGIKLLTYDKENIGDESGQDNTES